MKGNLATTYADCKQHEDALRLRKEVYSGYLRLYGGEHGFTLEAARNYANSLGNLKHFKEAKKLMRKMIPVAQRVVGDDETMLMRWTYARSLYLDPAATLDDLREAVTTLEELELTVRRVFGGAHPYIVRIECHLKESRAVLRARETLSRA